MSNRIGDLPYAENVRKIGERMATENERRIQLNVLTKAQLLERLHKLIGYADFSDLEALAKRAMKAQLVAAVMHAEADPANWRRMAASD